MGANAQTTVPTFTAGAVLTAAQQNASARTGVPVFATTTLRDAAFGGSNKTLAEGQMCYIEAAPQRYQVYNGTAWKDFHVNYTDVSSTQTFTGFTKGNATVVSKYTRLGDLVHFWGAVTLGSTSSITGELDITLPITAQGGTVYFPSSSWISDATAGSFICSAVQVGTTTIRMIVINTAGTYAANAAVSATSPMTWAVNDQFYWNHTYTAA